MGDFQDRLRELPAVDRLLLHARTRALLAESNREYVVQTCRAILDEIRLEIRSGTAAAGAVEEDAIVARVEARLTAAHRRGLATVVNATGTVLHTNLGRAPLARAAVQAVSRAASAPVALEYDLATGERGRREQVIERLLVELTGAEAATVVNNNAAAVLLALNTLASGREVVVSRGELIEIGGAFRIPEIMAASGAVLAEVGTTNRTHPADYENAIGERTGLLLKVHTSNYRIVGFVSEVDLPQLVAIGRRRQVPVMEDLGSGALVDLSAFGLPAEPVVADRVSLGADLVTFSGDKLLGGPQAGLIVGRATWVRAMMANPLHRALRCDKLTIAALEATLRLYRESPDLPSDLPALRMCTRGLAELEAIGSRAAAALRHALGPGFVVTLEDSTSQVGSGALPIEELPSKALAVVHETLNATQVAERFRAADPPIVGRIRGDRFLLDLRTIFVPEDLVPNWRD